MKQLSILLITLAVLLAAAVARDIRLEDARTEIVHRIGFLHVYCRLVGVGHDNDNDGANSHHPAY